MKNNIILLTVASFLVACMGKGTVLNDDGTPAGNLYWPDYHYIKIGQDIGTFPNLEDLEKVQPNMTRNQLYDLLGSPHFSEGFHVREWTYLFHFRTPNVGTNAISTCEYKVLFDKELIAQSYYWKSLDPLDGFCPPSSKKQRVYNLAADALFAFNQSDFDSITSRGQAELEELVETIREFSEINKITVNGHTDRLGSDKYNIFLSQRRAETVSEYIIAQGIQTDSIISHGYGEKQPIVFCNNKDTAALIACLQPNRRVEVLIDNDEMLVGKGRTKNN